MTDYVIGVDPGRRRIGIAVADLETCIARPLEVVDSRSNDPIARIGELVAETGATTVVVGRPTSLAGTAGPAVEEQQRFVEALRAAVTVRVAEFDERLTSVIAERTMRATGASAADRKDIRDAIAAQVMLQDYLDTSR